MKCLNIVCIAVVFTASLATQSTAAEMVEYINDSPRTKNPYLTPQKMDTVITMTITGKDTIKTITIQPAPRQPVQYVDQELAEDRRDVVRSYKKAVEVQSALSIVSIGASIVALILILTI